ncbi:hypothetical protein PPTG_23247 [Phytophthora nicotianae INRA-310]|uniref:Uncharacterized protein n=1 Tax=Phytophthora nicotianae (strain INRA-310) TaxID=761204 RepID=W2Q4P0_PHYN3|nr:hypothetical protein PPTG_23247 [Phytophthora nicotianae INRA-310]ETN07235.1 hypothetical protein PPTG_23247 [Phytophthora nicotianae INRA-310]
MVSVSCTGCSGAVEVIIVGTWADASWEAEVVPGQAAITRKYFSERKANAQMAGQPRTSRGKIPTAASKSDTMATWVNFRSDVAQRLGYLNPGFCLEFLLCGSENLPELGHRVGANSFSSSGAH